MDFKLTNEDRKFFRVGFSNTLIIVLICFYFFMWAINRHYDLAYPIVTFLIFFVTLFFYFYYSTCISSILSSGEKIVIKKAFSETSINISDIKNISIYHLPATAIWIFFKTKQRRFPRVFTIIGLYTNYGSLKDTVRKLEMELNEILKSR